MKPYYEDNHRTIYKMNFLENDLPSESVQCVVTSPPYWGLRKYAGEQDVIWGDNHCGHQWGDLILNPMSKSGKHGPASILTKTADEQHAVRKESNQGSFCSLCGAWKGAYGLEPTPEMYVEHTITFLREIRRVLRKDGVVFWNIGDSYAGYWGDKKALAEKRPSLADGHGYSMNSRPKYDQFRNSGIKPKDICLIPFRVAIAAQEDGWWVRSVIIWSKPNPMPESVIDRPTESHEYILMLTKAKKYYWDQDAVRENYSESYANDSRYGATELIHSPVKDYQGQGKEVQTPTQLHDNMFTKPIGAGRNIRTVWEFPTQPYPEAHFAVFPERLPELCIKAATKEGDTVLDPFMGAGTTLWVASKLNRKSIGFDISEEYCDLTVERNRQQVLTSLTENKGYLE